VALELGCLPSELRQKATKADIAEIIAFKELQHDAAHTTQQSKKLNNEQALAYLKAWGSE
jgi:hypothetical protein